jgi:hypothetical protein
MIATLLKEEKRCSSSYNIPVGVFGPLDLIEVTDPVGNIITIKAGMTRKGWKIFDYRLQPFSADKNNLNVEWVYSA